MIDPDNVHRQDARSVPSLGRAYVVLQEAAETFVAPNRGPRCWPSLSPLDHFIGKTLVGAFEMVMIDVLADSPE